MGRRPEGFKVSARGGGWYYVRFTHQGREHFVSTGETDPRAAHDAAAQIYADTVAGKARTAKTARGRSKEPLATLIAKWIASITGVLDERTVETYATSYAQNKWLVRWSTLAAMADDSALATYRDERLRGALAKTLRKELSAMFGSFFQWCVDHGHLTEDSVPRRPRIGKKTKGRRVGPQREHAPQYSEKQIENALAALPLRGRSLGGRPGYPHRARWAVEYDTGLRPATIEALVWSDWKGATMTVRSEVDKARFGRDVPLTRRVQRLLAALLDETNGHAVRDDLIFGKVDARAALAAAAKVAGLPSLAPYDFRHARATHLVDSKASITGVAYLLGDSAETTAKRYVHSGPEAARAALGAGVKTKGKKR
jgi:integrase